MEKISKRQRNLMDKCGFVGTTFKQPYHLPSTVSSNERFTLASFRRNKFNEILFQRSALLICQSKVIPYQMTFIYTIIQNQFLVIIFTFFLKFDACNFLNLLHCLNLTMMILIHRSLFVLPRFIKFYYRIGNI